MGLLIIVRVYLESIVLNLCNLFEGRFWRQEPQSTLWSSLRRMTQRVDEPLAEFAERTLKTASDGHTGMPGVWV